MSSERRRYFRIQDSILVQYRVIQGDMLDSERRELELNRTRIENARAALFGIESDFQEAVSQVRSTSPSIGKALELLNRKINLIERVISTEVMTPSPEDTATEHELKSVNISAGGMAVSAQTPVAVGAKLVVDLVLLPSHDPMRIFGVVVNCREIARDEHEIGVEFTEIRREDEEKLVQHVLHLQSRMLREQRKHLVS